MTERLRIKEILTYYADFNDMVLDDVIERLKDYKEMISDKGGIEGSARVEYEFYNDYDGFYVLITYERFETDKEYDRRMKKNTAAREKRRKDKEKAKERRRAEYEKLKKEFGG